VWTSLRITVLVLFRYASPCLCNQLPASVRQRATSLYLCLSLLFYTGHLVFFVSTLLPPTTPSLFRFRLKITPYTDLVYHRLSSYLCIDSTDFYHYRFLLSLSVFAFLVFPLFFFCFLYFCARSIWLTVSCWACVYRTVSSHNLMLLEYSGVQIGYQKVLQILSVHHLVHFALILYFTVRYATSVISGGGG